MRKNKIVFLIFVQIFMISMVFFVYLTYTQNFSIPTASNYQPADISINSNADLIWTANGTTICTYTGD